MNIGYLWAGYWCLFGYCILVFGYFTTARREVLHCFPGSSNGRTWAFCAIGALAFGEGA